MRSLSHHCLSSELDAQLVSVDLMPRSVPLDRENTLLLKRQCSSVDSLPHDVIELILERLPVESLLRFKTVSNKWKLTIEARRFQERQLIRRMQTRGPDVLCVCRRYDFDDGLDTEARRIMLGSSIVSTVRPPTLRGLFCHGSCDGLVCLYDIRTTSMNVVVNPATRWHQCFPLSSYQKLLIEKNNRCELPFQIASLGFGKDNIRGTYKPVWLHNSYGFGLDNVTTCEVFDFSTNAWRYVLPASPYPILTFYDPVYLDGSLYWLTKCEETKVLSFHLHSETFQVISKTPFAISVSKTPFTRISDPYNINMCILNNRLCLSEKKWPIQVIWSYDSSGGNKKWEKMCSIDLTKIFPWFGEHVPDFALSPIAILEKNKLLLQGHDYFRTMVMHDLHTKSCELLFKPTKPVGAVYYFQSLLSDVAN